MSNSCQSMWPKGGGNPNINLQTLLNALEPMGTSRFIIINQLLLLLNLTITWILVQWSLSYKKGGGRAVNTSGKLWLWKEGEQISGYWLHLVAGCSGWILTGNSEAPDATHQRSLRCLLPRAGMFDRVCQSQDCLLDYQGSKTMFISPSINKRHGVGVRGEQAASFYFRGRGCKGFCRATLVGHLWVSMS